MKKYNLQKACRNGKVLGNPGKREKRQFKRDPLPMKLRALPQSFWQQPNNSGVAPPSACEPVASIQTEENTYSRLEVTQADTDLLFSLFKSLPQANQQEYRPATRRGRPRKNHVNDVKSKDDDPYVTSITVPEVKFQKEAMVETETLAMMAFQNFNHDRKPHSEISYAQRLQDLAVNL